MKVITLNTGEKTLVCDEDFDFLNQWKWRCLRRGKSVYAVRNEYLGVVDGKSKMRCVYMHRVIAERAGLDLSDCIDHKNHDGLDNQRDNLRPATRKQNQENRKVTDHNSSGVVGVMWNRHVGKWQARITHHRKRIHLGLFDRKSDAVAARKNAEKQYYTHSPVS